MLSTWTSRLPRSCRAVTDRASADAVFDDTAEASMRAAQFSRFGAPDVLEIVALPDPHPGGFGGRTAGCGVGAGGGPLRVTGRSRRPLRVTHRGEGTPRQTGAGSGTSAVRRSRGTAIAAATASRATTAAAQNNA